MSTVCKLDPAVRQQRTARANLLRNPPRVALEGTEILERLAQVARRSDLTGAEKHQRFTAGSERLREYVR